MTAAPVYPPFLSAPVFSGRECLRVPLRLELGRWQWDLDAAQAALTPRTRLLMLCHPHNPVGRAWTREELLDIAAFAERNGLIVCSDEIHADLMLIDDRRHLPFACLGEEVARRTITLMAPSKTYNIPGLGCSLAVVPDPGLRRQLRHALRGIVPDVGVLGFVATEAAYRHGVEWRRALLAYLRDNAAILVDGLQGLPGITVTRPEATYLAWLDARGIGRPDPQAFFEAAGVGLSNGADFGAPGFVRLNFGCARRLVEMAVGRLRAALGATA
jgi:cystathionine beta-lyase